MVFGMIGGMLIFWIILIGLSILVVRSLFHAGQSTELKKPLSAQKILEERYARGEINQEQYKLMLKDIQ
ncbi:MAG: hypothetical protein CL609_15340 [Anaerolineaceae bacterium]|nr:hypothetical protein [Anaerolineaceae bacterium]